jgi:hypothetical protein
MTIECRTIEFNAIEFTTAHQAIQWTEADGRGVAILVDGRNFVVDQAEADRLAAAGAVLRFGFGLEVAPVTIISGAVAALVCPAVSLLTTGARPIPEPEGPPSPRVPRTLLGAPVWRVGANQTTRLKTEVPLIFEGKTLPVGEYSVFVDLLRGSGGDVVLGNENPSRGLGSTTPGRTLRHHRSSSIGQTPTPQPDEGGCSCPIRKDP